MSEFPKLVVDLKKLENNVKQIKKRCEACGIEIAGVIKGCSGIPECAKVYAESGAKFIASSRLDQIEKITEFGVTTPKMLIRIPMKSEIKEAIRLTDISLNSEIEVLKELDKEAKLQNKKHKVILMVDLGDLREGFWKKEELLEAALMVENQLENLELAGIGTNLGCYGAIAATKDKLNELVLDAEMIEAKIGRKLEYISGGATTSLPRIFDGDMPERVNLLRLGESVLLGKDLQDLWGYDMSFMNLDVFTIQAEIIEVKDKPTYPVGEIVVDAFGFTPEYEDRGIRKRALIGLGKVDYAFTDMIYPRIKGVEILGASSDHTILDIEDAEAKLNVGDVLDFDVCYGSMVYVTNSPNVKIEIKK
ncbi:MAG: alanine/ornithine racemase family PLP-dependent enzyme [Anaerovoracaceae bacterium]